MKILNTVASLADTASVSIKPCPFCRAVVPALEVVHSWRGGAEKLRTALVVCHNCSGRGPIASTPPTDRPKTDKRLLRALAIHLWNDRI